MAYKKGTGERNSSALLRKLAVFEFLIGKRVVSLKDLMAEFQVSDDTMRRDIADLEAAGLGVDIEYDDDDRGRVLYRLKKRTYVDTAITRGEAHSLASTRRYWSPYRGTPFHADIESVTSKLAASLPAAEREEIERDHGRCYFIPDGGTKNYEPKKKLVKAFQRAVTHRRRVRYLYRPLAGKKPRTGTMEPHGVVYYKNTVYILGRNLQSARSQKKGLPHRLEWVKWPVERFEKVDLLPEGFEVAAAFRIEDHFDGWGIIQGEKRERVVVDFDPERAPFIAEREWPNTVERTWLPDGWFRLVFETGNLREVVGWILSHGSHAVVMGPEALRSVVLAELRSAAERVQLRGIGA